MKQPNVGLQATAGKVKSMNAKVAKDRKGKTKGEY